MSELQGECLDTGAGLSITASDAVRSVVGSPWALYTLTSTCFSPNPGLPVTGEPLLRRESVTDLLVSTLVG